MDREILKKLIKGLKGSNQEIKLKNIKDLSMAAKRGKNISLAVEELIKSLALKNDKVWKAAADALSYYFRNFVSLYCRNYGDLPDNFTRLKSQKINERQAAAKSLDYYTKQAEGRIWKYMEKEKMEKLANELENSEPKTRKEAAEALSKAANNFIEISDAVPLLEAHLLDDDEEVRWACAKALGIQIGNYMGTLSVHPWYSFDDFKTLDVNERASIAEGIGSSMMYDIVCDRDERDMSHALPGLALLLKDKSARVRKEAIQALRMGQSEHNLTSLIPSIIDAILDIKRKNIHEQASGIIKKAITDGFNISKYIEQFEKLVKGNTGKELRKEIVLIMRKAVEKGHDLKNHVVLFETLLKDEIDEVKFGAADTLTYYHALKKNWKKIEELFKNEDKDVRQEASGTLEQLNSKINIGPMRASLISLLKDEDKEVRFVVARTILKKFEDDKILTLAVPIIIESASDTDPRIVKNAIFLMTQTIHDKVTCRNGLKTTNWDALKPFMPVLEGIFKSKGKGEKKRIARILAQFYIHLGEWDKIRSLLKHRSHEVKKEVIFQLGSCGWSDCEIIFSPLVPELLSMYFKIKNQEVRKAVLGRLEKVMRKDKASVQLVKEELEKYDINKSWELLDKTRRAVNKDVEWKMGGKIDKLSEKEQFKKYLSLISHENSRIREWATDKLWNYLYTDDDSFAPAIPLLIENLNDDDVFVRHVTVSVLGGANRHKYDISNGIPSLAQLLSDNSEKVRHLSASTLSTAAEKGLDITIAIPDLIKNIGSSNSELSYFSSLAPRNHVKDEKSARLVMKELEEKRVDMKNKEVKRLIEKCNEYMIEINNALEELLKKRFPEKLFKTKIERLINLIILWNEHWGSHLNKHLIEMLISAIFRKREIKGWNECLKIFFPEAAEMAKLNLKTPKKIPSFPFNYPPEKLEKIYEALRDSAELVGQDEWDSLFDFN